MSERKTASPMSKKFIPKPIEPKILPLVEAINRIKWFKTFSSCEGHFKKKEQEITDRNHADVRFDLLKNGTLEQAEHFMWYLIAEFGNGVIPAYISAYKLYVPKAKGQSDFVFVIQIFPINRFESAKNKRKHTDMGIQRATIIVDKYAKKIQK